MPFRKGMLAALLLLNVTGVQAADPVASPGDAARTEMIAVLHLHTTLGDGAASPRELARAARAAGVDVLVITDHFLERVTYAPWPIGNVMGLSFSRPSVLTVGLDRYFDALAAAEKETPGVLLLPGLEVTPYARFTGSLLSGTLGLQGWHRHVLVIGIEDREALRSLPVADNRRGGRYGPWSLLFLVPIAALAWSAAGLARPVYRETRLANYVIRRRRIPVLKSAVGALSIVLLAAGFPYRIPRWSAVGADPGDAPFRCLEDRVRSLGGVTSWAHPEAAAEKDARGVRIATAPYPDMVARTDADAFGALPEGITRLLPPGGLWDRALGDHVAGRRSSAPFALAELDEHGPAREANLKILQTVCSVRERTHAGIAEALRTGRTYARWTPENVPPLRLTAWEVRGARGQPAGAGETLREAGALTLRLAVEGGDGREVTARIVRLGEVIWSARLAPPFARDVPDSPARPAFYRVDIEGAYPYRLIGNPIFVMGPPALREGK